MKEEKVFVVILDSKLGMIISDLKKFLYEDNYEIISQSGWTGFYDWLRNDEGQVIGVRYCPFEKTQFICNIAKNLPYTIASNVFVEFYFTSERNYISESSDDQQFTKNWVLRSKSGKYAITFNIDTLSEDEKKQLLAISASKMAESLS